VEKKIGVGILIDICDNPRHCPISFEIPGVDIHCPLCLSLDRNKELEGRIKLAIEALRVIEDDLGGYE
jgi:hypothetical protein